MRYMIVRVYLNDDRSRVIKRGLTLRQAKAHCRDPETSSSTAKGPDAVTHTDRYGPWFDGYTEERR